MPYKKKYRYGGKRGRQANRYLGVASKALSVALATKKLLNVEYKAHTVASTADAMLDGTGVIVQLSNIPQGDTSLTRDGNQCKIMSIEFKAHVKMSVFTSNAINMCRVMLVQDNQTNGAIFTSGILLSNVTNAGSVVSGHNINNAGRFRILKNWAFTLDANGKSSRAIQYYRKMQLKIRYDAAAADITDITQKSLALVFFSDQTTGNEPDINYFCRLRFVDN